MKTDHARLFEAVEFATKAHSGQFRKASKIPYITHPLSVGNMLMQAGMSEDLVIAGYLHDTLEDTDATLDQIRDKFGDEVAKLVQSVSEPEHDNNPWEERKAHTVEQLKSAHINIVLITCADKLDNIRSIKADYEKLGEDLWNRFNRPKEKQKWYYQSLAQVLNQRAKEAPVVPFFAAFDAEVKAVFAD